MAYSDYGETNAFGDAVGNHEDYNKNESYGGPLNTSYDGRLGPPNYSNYQYEEFFYYEFFEFERPVYLFTWEMLVILTTLANILVTLVLARKYMRSATNTILIAIAVSDSFTGLVTLPTYIYAFQHYERKHLKLTEYWCEAFMLSKLFLSKAFHTMSVWLTVCLGIQRYISVSRPFRAQTMFTIPKTLMMVVVIVILSPILHVYHLTNKKSIGTRCAWALKDNCYGDCAYLWITFLLMHFIPCVILVVVTSLMIYTLWHTEARMHASMMISSHKNLKRRAAQSRRISIIVVVVVVIFLIPEIPYGIFLLISVSLKHQGKDLMELKTNRAFHCAYELLLISSFHANFWVYIIMNRKFRSGLIRSFDPCRITIFRFLGVFGIKKEIVRRPSVSSSFGSRHETDPPTKTISQFSNSNNSVHEMKTFRLDSMQPLTEDH